MATKAGVWIDHKQAIVVLLTDGGEQTKKVAFDIGQLVQTKGKSPAKHKHRRNDFIPDDRLERKTASDRQDYYDDVIAGIQGADALLILGPAEAKTELSQRIAAKKVKGLAVALETADKMTDRQLLAKVRQSFSTTPEKPAAPAPVAKKATPKAAPKMATKKTATKKTANKQAGKKTGKKASQKKGK